MQMILGLTDLQEIQKLLMIVDRDLMLIAIILVFIGILAIFRTFLR
jgi:predicted RND superfamily exporter protein